MKHYGADRQVSIGIRGNILPKDIGAKNIRFAVFFVPRDNRILESNQDVMREKYGLRTIISLNLTLNLCCGILSL